MGSSRGGVPVADTVGSIVKIGGFAGAIAVGGALGGFLAPLLLVGSSIAGALLRKRGLGRAQEGIQQNVLSNEAFIPIVYGEAKIGITLADVRVDTNSTDNKDLALVGAICSGGENGDGIEGVSKVWFNEILAIDPPIFESEPSVSGIDAAFQGGGPFASGSWFEYGLHSGADTQVVDAELAARFPSSWGATGTGRGVAHLAAILNWNQDIFPGGIPNVTVQVKGNKVYDPRSSTWAWSDNPALCVLDYITSKRYGMGATYSERDGGGLSEIDEQSFIDAANHCDVLVSIPGGTQKRFTCNGWLDPGVDAPSNLEALLTSCRGQIVYASGKFRLVIRQVVTPETFELTEDNIIGDWEFFRAGTRETPNKAVATFINSNLDYQPDDASWPEADASNGFLTADNGFENERRFDLPFTDNKYMAQHIGLVSLKEARADTGAAVTCTEAALQLQVGEVVPLTHSTPGWTQKEFWVLALFLLPNGTVRVVLREYDATAYTLDTLNTEDTPPGTQLPNPLLVQPPTGLTLLSDATTAIVLQEGVTQPRIKVTWTDSVDPFKAGTLVEWKVTAEADTTYRPLPIVLPGIEQAFISPVSDGTEYTVRIRETSTSGAMSVTATATVTVGTTPITLVAEPTVEATSTASTDTTETFTITGTAGANGGPTIKVRHRERTGGGAWGAWSAWFANPKTGVVITRAGKKNKTLQVVARDESNGNLESVPESTLVDPELSVVQSDGTIVLDDVTDGTTFVRTTPNEKTGADRGFTAIDAGGVVVTSAVDFARSYANKGALAEKNAVDLATAEVTNKSADNIPESATKKWAAESGANVTESRTAAAIAGQGALATKSAADFATEVTGAAKPADNADVTGSNTAADTTLVNGTAASTVKAGAVRANNSFDADKKLKADTEVAGDIFIPNTAAPLVGTAAAPSSIAKTLRIPAHHFAPQTEAITWNAGNGDLRPRTANVSGIYEFSVPLPKGVTITAYRIRAYRQTTSDLASGSLVRINDAGGTTGLGSVTHSGTGWSTISNTSPNQLVGDEGYFVEVSLRGVSSANNARIMWIEVDYTMPSYDKGY